jgi:hypothetical protein
MANQPKPQRLEDVEITADASERFRAAVHAAVKSGPKHGRPKPKSDPVEKVEQA